MIQLLNGAHIIQVQADGEQGSVRPPAEVQFRAKGGGHGLLRLDDGATLRHTQRRNSSEHNRWRSHSELGGVSGREVRTQPQKELRCRGIICSACSIPTSKYVVIDIIAEHNQQPAQPIMSNAFTEVTSPIDQKFYTAPSAAQGDKDNASTAIYRQLCQQMQRPENKDKFHVETTHDRSKLTTLTRSLAAVLVTIDHHRDLLLGDADREFWEEHKEKRSMTQ